MNKRNIVLVSSVILALVIVLGSFWYFSLGQKQDFKETREEQIASLDQTLREATEKGDYECCIDPPCKMCYFGNWRWDDGKCRCDEEIDKGNWDDVCPECVRGIEEGKCKSKDKPCPKV